MSQGIVPDIILRNVRTWQRVRKNAGEPLGDIVVRKLGGCASLDSECEHQILQKNRKRERKIFDVEFAGELSLPLQILQANINIWSAADKELGGFKPIPISVARPDENLSLTQINPFVGCDSEENSAPDNLILQSIRICKLTTLPALSNAARYEVDMGDLKYLFRELGQNLVPNSRVSPLTAALEPQDFAKFQADLRALISIPFDAPNKYPGYAQRTGIAVFDTTSVDPTHCAFRETARFDFGNEGPVQSASDCSFQENALRDTDHATHIVGLIAGRYSNSSGKDLIWGLNPKARVMARQLDLTLGPSDPGGTGLQRAAEEISKVSENKFFTIGVVNLSLGYPVSQNASYDPVERLIEAQQDDILFVAAAGNDGANKSHICDVRPACFDLPNVISVAALNGDLQHPDLLKNDSGKLETNYGSNIAIGAIGKVLSTISKGRYGELEGSSQAAPQVAAVASLMIGKYKTLAPHEIKDRLIYCSDFVGEFDGRLKHGRLNAECALDGDLARVELKTGEVLRGKIHLDAVLKFRHATTGRTIEHSLETIRAIHYSAKTRGFIIYFIAYDADQNSRLGKESNMMFADPAQKLTIEPEDRPLTEFPVSDIVRFTSPAKCQ